MREMPYKNLNQYQYTFNDMKKNYTLNILLQDVNQPSKSMRKNTFWNYMYPTLGSYWYFLNWFNIGVGKQLNVWVTSQF
jgi:hypothetical protein